VSGVFISYKFTGEDPAVLERILAPVAHALIDAGSNFFCSYFMEDEFRKKGLGKQQILEYCLKEQENYGTVLSLLWSDGLSEGMVAERLKARELRQAYILALDKQLDVENYVRKADVVLLYRTASELAETVREMFTPLQSMSKFDRTHELLQLYGKLSN